jgi:hypothetical protein
MRQSFGCIKFTSMTCRFRGGCPSKIASNSNLQPSPIMHSLPTNHHIYPIFFIHMSLAPLFTLSSASQHLLAIPRCKTEFCKHAFSCSAPWVWCNIPVEIQLAPSIAILKRHLETHFSGPTSSRPTSSPT